MNIRDTIMKNALLVRGKQDELKDMTENEIIKALESLFSLLIEANYPDCDFLLIAGNNVKNSGHFVDNYLINFLKVASTSFDEALICWFLVSYWSDRRDTNQYYSLVLFKRVEYMKENPDYGNKTACLLALTKLLDVKLLYKKDAQIAVEVLRFLRKEFEEQSKSEELKRNALYSALKKILKEGRRLLK